MNLNKLYSRKYVHDYGKIKKYTNTSYKVIHMTVHRLKDIEETAKIQVHYTSKGEAGNTEKLSESLSRSRSKVFELSICNDWKYFVTFTLDRAKYDRYNLNKFIKDLSQFIRDYKKKYNTKITYLLIPEKHTDGAWHLHGFLNGLPVEHLTPFSINDKLPIKIIKRLMHGKHVYTWKAYENKFGFADFELIENKEASSKYITKYITEDIKRSVTELNAHIYYCSKGLQHAQIMHEGMIKHEIQNPDYKNDYVAVKMFDNYKAARECFE